VRPTGGNEVRMMLRGISGEVERVCTAPDAHNAVAAIVQMYGRIVAAQADRIRVLEESNVALTKELGENRVRDLQNRAGLPGQERRWAEPVQTEPVEGRGKGPPGSG
jgi:hypothetical protein